MKQFGKGIEGTTVVTVNRREFVQWTSVAVAAVTGKSAFARGGITGLEVVDRIKAKLAEEGVKWGPSQFDGFHLGEPGTIVSGVAVTFEPTLDVLQRAAAKGKNLVVSHESTFWDGFDPVQVMQDDPVHRAKVEFAHAHQMMVWRIHDHWHRRKPDPIFMGLANKLGWSSCYDNTTRPGHYVIPEMRLEQVARHFQERLQTMNVVVVGDPKLRVSTIGDCAHVLSSVLPSLYKYDVALVGETPEHDTFEYVRDAMAIGEQKAVVMISHADLEEWGMQEFASWVKPLVPELVVEWIPTGGPFQVPIERVPGLGA